MISNVITSINRIDKISDDYCQDRTRSAWKQVNKDLILSYHMGVKDVCEYLRLGAPNSDTAKVLKEIAKDIEERFGNKP